MKHDPPSETLRDIESALEAYLQDPISCVSLPPCPQKSRVSDAMRYAVLGGGKRIRPLLVLSFCELAGGNPQDALPFACAVEMVHAYSLVHDDLPCMDNDLLRRGKKTCHVVFGEAIALLAGDALLTYAFEILSTAPISREHPRKGMEAMATLASCSGVGGMVGGQALDLLNEADSSPCQDELIQIDTLKTAALLRASTTLGVLAAPATTELHRQVAATYAHHLGIAFQLIDDLLDVTGDPQKTGKERHRDQKLGKTTMIDLIGLEQAQVLAAYHTKQALGALDRFPQAQTASLRTLSHSLLDRIH